MLSSRRNTLSMSGEKVDVRFSHFKVLQVPKGWDKLFVSLVSVETGKTLARSSKALVRNGSCKWPEATTESVCISQDDSLKNLEDSLFKFVVAMGSARYGILGEATINVTSYISSRGSIPISLPLKKCNHGTILQLKIQCLTPRTNLRDEKSEDRNSCMVELCHNMDIRSEGPDNTLAKNVVCPSSKHLVSTSDSGELGSRGTNFSALSSYHSNDSAARRDNSSNEGHGLINRQDSISSQGSAPYSSYSNESPSRSNNSSQSQCSPRDDAPSELHLASSSNNLVQPGGNTIEEIQVEAKMWERNARRLMLDLDVLRKECSDQSKSLENLEMELSVACAERDSLRKEVEQLKEMLEKSIAKQREMETIQGDEQNVQEELENEIIFQKESNANLALQLKRSQVSHIELVSVIQEMEGTIESQKVEIENFSAFQSKISEMENAIQYQEEENAKLLFQLQQLGESENKLQAKVLLLERALERRNSNVETECNQISGNCIEMEATNRGNANLIKEIKSLREKVDELERDCNELTDENLDLLFKLKEMKKCSSREGASFGFSSSESSDITSTISDSELGEQKSKVQHLEEKLKNKISKDLENKYYTEKLELEAKLSELKKGLNEERSEMHELKDRLMSKEEQIELLRRHKSKLEVQLSNLRRDKDEMEEKMEHLRHEKSELGLHYSELERDKVELTARICTLETQLSCLIGERESCQLELQHFKSLSVSLQDEIAKLRNEKESHEKDLDPKLQYMQNRLLETQEECEYLRKANTKLQASSESLIEECRSLQKSKEELENHKKELLERYTNLEAKFGESCTGSTFCSGRVNNLDETLFSMVEEMTVQEKSPTSKLDALFDKIRKHEESHKTGGGLMNQNQRKRECGTRFDYENLFSKIYVLENELVQAKEANNMYKAQLQGLLSKGQKGHQDAPKKETARGKVVPKESYEYTILSLETELKDIRDRYLQMSLKYAEVEAQREELVMKLKAAKKGEKWFS